YVEEKYSTLYKKLDENEKQQLRDIVNKIYKNRVENHIADVVLKINENIKNPEAMNQNQWGNYKDLFDYIAILEPEEGIKKYNEYMNDIKNKRSISDEQLSKVKYADKGLKDLFDKMIKNSRDIDMFYEEIFKDVDRVRIGNITSEIDEKFAYQMNLKILIELTRKSV